MRKELNKEITQLLKGLLQPEVRLLKHELRHVRKALIQFTTANCYNSVEQILNAQAEKKEAINFCSKDVDALLSKVHPSRFDLGTFSACSTHYSINNVKKYIIHIGDGDISITTTSSEYSDGDARYNYICERIVLTKIDVTEAIQLYRKWESQFLLDSYTVSKVEYQEPKKITTKYYLHPNEQEVEIFNKKRFYLESLEN